MAQWQKLNSLCQQHRGVNEKIMEIYGRIPIPYKIRSGFADWIEQQNWSLELNTETGAHHAEALFMDMLSKIQDLEESMLSNVPYDLEKVMDIQRAKQEIKKLQSDSFVRTMKSCLQEEKMLLESFSDRNEPKSSSGEILSNGVSRNMPEIREKLQDMTRQIVVAENRVITISQEQEKLVSIIYEQTEKLSTIERQLNSLNMHNNTSKAELAHTKKSLETTQESLIQAHFSKRDVVAEGLINLAIRLAYLLQMIWTEIRKWQNEQKLVAVGLAMPPRLYLDNLDSLCEEAGLVLNRVILQVEKALVIYRRFPNPGSANAVDDQMTKLDLVHNELLHDYLPKHLISVFIVEQSVPNGILCVDGGKSALFRVSVRILGGRAFGLGFSRPLVKMSLVNKSILNSTTADANDALSECAFSVDNVTGRCRAEFQGVHVENKHHLNRNSAVAGWKLEKFAFMFQTMVHFCGCDIPLQTLSHPVLLTNNSTDDVIARGLLVWDAAFSEPGRKPFVCKDVVRWGEFANVLNTLFAVNTGRGLDASHLDYLARFLFNDNKSVDLSNRSVREKQAIWDNLSGRRFSFWAWFWANLAVARDIVGDEWRAGLIYGFISKEDARNKLLDSPRGTFLLRFSESEIDMGDQRSADLSYEQKTEVYGHLTIAVTEYDSAEAKTKKLYYIKDYLSPRSVKDKSLAEILGAMEVADVTKPNGKKPLLEHLWPDTKKEFSEHFTAFSKDSNRRNSYDANEDENGYKRSKFTIEIFLNEDAGRTKTSCVSRIRRQDSTSSTATSMSAHSSMTDVSVEDGNASCGSSSPTPQFVLCMSADASRPTATVHPQPAPIARAVMPSTHRLVLPTTHQGVGNGGGGDGGVVYGYPTDDEDSMDTIVSVGPNNAGVQGAASLTFGFANNFAAFNLHEGHS